MSNKKRSHAQRFRGITIPGKSHPAIKRVRRQGNTPSIHGNKFWDSSCLLIDYLHKNPPEHYDTV
ncbi:MAG: methyltransferase, partial [Halioglobus sp.]|nr:methyltransferase [Halioglobus sp.]